RCRETLVVCRGLNCRFGGPERAPESRGLSVRVECLTGLQWPKARLTEIVQTQQPPAVGPIHHLPDLGWVAQARPDGLLRAHRPSLDVVGMRKARRSHGAADAPSAEIAGKCRRAKAAHDDGIGRRKLRAIGAESDH